MRYSSHHLATRSLEAWLMLGPSRWLGTGEQVEMHQVQKETVVLRYLHQIKEQPRSTQHHHPGGGEDTITIFGYIVKIRSGSLHPPRYPAASAVGWRLNAARHLLSLLPLCSGFPP